MDSQDKDTSVHGHMVIIDWRKPKNKRSNDNFDENEEYQYDSTLLDDSIGEEHK